MKEYKILTIQCPKEYNLTTIFSIIRKKVNSDKNFFYLRGLEPSDKLRTSLKKIYDEIDLDRFSYLYIPDYLVQAGMTDRLTWLYSNLDSRWTSPNFNNICEPLSGENFDKLLDFYDKLPRSRLLLDEVVGLDEIEWEGNKVAKGTYGYKKADAWIKLGSNYLSNAIIVSRFWRAKQYTVYISCEKQFSDLAVIREVAESLGKVKSEQSFFAPEGAEERAQWVETYKEAEKKFTKATEGIKELKLEKYENGMNDPSKIINIRQLLKKHLCDNGWSIRKKLPDEYGIMISKDKDDAVLSLSVMSRHNGQHLIIDACYRHKKFYFYDRLPIMMDGPDEEQIEIYLKNVRIIRDHLDEMI